MNQSFYKDILDIEKQKAILEDLGKNKQKKTSAVEKPTTNKPNTLTKTKI